ncbi:adenylyl-sulfate kinase, partial [Myxococcota bacterium]
RVTQACRKRTIYIRSGELMCWAEEPVSAVGMAFEASVFWLGKRPLIKGKRYKLKLHTSSTSAYLREVRSVIDAADLGRESGRGHVERHEVAECVLETMRPVAFDVESSETGRFVIVDDYEIAGGGIIAENLAQQSELLEQVAVSRKTGWVLGNIGEAERRTRYHQQPKLVLVTGAQESELNDIGARLERRLFENGRYVYFLGMANLVEGLGVDVRFEQLGRDEHLRRLGELARLFADAGCILVAAVPGLDAAEFRLLAALSGPAEVLVVAVGEELHDAPADLVLPGRTRSEVSGHERSVVERELDPIMTFLTEREVILDHQIRPDPIGTGRRDWSSMTVRRAVRGKHEYRGRAAGLCGRCRTRRTPKGQRRSVGAVVGGDANPTFFSGALPTDGIRSAA